MSTQTRRTHSSIDKLPRELIQSLIEMMVDNAWPADYEGEKRGKPRYEDMAAYVQQKGSAISVHAIGRYCRRLRTLARMKEAGVLVRDVMKNLDGEKVSATQKAVAEMITSVIIEYVGGHDNMKAKDLALLARATRDCSKVAIDADKYIRERIKENVRTADKNISEIAKKKKISPETLSAIRKQVYGIVDDFLGLSKPVTATDIAQLKSV